MSTIVKSESDQTDDGSSERTNEQNHDDRYVYILIAAGVLLTFDLVLFFKYTDGVFNQFSNLREQAFGLSVVHSFFCVALLIGLHEWSVIKTDEAYEKAMDPEIEGWSPDSECKYCGSTKPEPRLVCSLCDSIQWNANERWLCWAIFVAHHRWKIFAVIMGFLWVAPLIALKEDYVIRSEKATSERSEFEKSSQKAIDKLLTLRSAILEFEQVHSNQSEKTPDTWYHTFVEEFYQSSWYASKVFDYLKYTSCDKVSDDEGQNIRFSCLVVEQTDNNMYKLDTLFLELATYYKQALLNEQNSIVPEKRLQVAEELYRHAKVLSCAIGELSYNEGVAIKRSDDSLRKKIYDCECALTYYVSGDTSCRFPFNKFLPWAKVAPD